MTVGDGSDGWAPPAGPDTVPPKIVATAPVQGRAPSSPPPADESVAPVLSPAATDAPISPAPPASPPASPAAPATATATASAGPTVVTPRPAPGAGTVYAPGQAGPAYPGAGGLYPMQPWVLVPVQPPPRRRRALPWFLGIITTLTVLAVVALGGFVAITQYGGAGSPRGTWRAAPSPTDLPPAQNAPASEWASWARRAVDGRVEAQAEALLAGDEARYLAAVDPDNEDLLAEHRRRFEVLRAMGPGVWTQNVTGIPKFNGDRAWTADLRVSYCFGESTCEPVQLVVGSEWELRDDNLVMTDLTPSGADEIGPRPWETDDLSVRTGERVIVASQKANQWRLADAVKAGDRAAAVADRLSRWSDPPSRYVIFLAGPDDWNRWYGHEQPEWAAAWAVPVSATVTEVVIRTQVVQQRGLEALLTHELAHVTTLAGDRDGAGRNSWWLVEGIADYATMVGKSVRSYDALVPTRSYVRAKWDGDPTVDAPSSSSSLEEASARYGIAFLAVRHIAEKYTEEKMLDFFGRVVHDNESLDTASRVALGVDWSTVEAECVKFIRNSVA